MFRKRLCLRIFPHVKCAWPVIRTGRDDVRSTPSAICVPDISENKSARSDVEETATNPEHPRVCGKRSWHFMVLGYPEQAHPADR